VYTWIRTDLPTHQQIIQSAHSALEAGRTFPEHHGTSHLVLLQADSEEYLLSIAEYLAENGINHRMFYEPDDDYGHTSITTEPIYGPTRNIFKHFKLYKGN
jgi:hypothetical protein